MEEWLLLGTIIFDESVFYSEFCQNGSYLASDFIAITCMLYFFFWNNNDIFIFSVRV